MRGIAFQNYSAGEYETAFTILKKLVLEDHSALFWMDYFMLADIYLRREQVDSARWVIDLGDKRTKTSSDPRFQKRNGEIWQNLREQLKFQRATLTPPAYRSLESFAEKAPDSSKTDTTKKVPQAPTIADTSTQAMNQAPDSIGKNLHSLFSPAEDSMVIPRRPEGFPGNEPPFHPAIASRPKILGGNNVAQEYIDQNKLFPDSALSVGVNMGTVMLNVTIDTSGIPKDFSIIRSSPAGMGFEQLAVEVMKKMKYEPAVSDSGKVEGILPQRLTFKKPE
jgi:TonB family protein